LRTNETHAECLNRHQLDYAGAMQIYSRHLDMDAVACALCTELHLDRRGWLLVDHTRVRRVDEGVEPVADVEFVLYPPRERAGIGEIRLWFERAPVAHVRLQMCRVDRRGVVAHVEVTRLTGVVGWRRC
jgi:hypothetical protein